VKVVPYHRSSRDDIGVSAADKVKPKDFQIRPNINEYLQIGEELR